jgi:hypothetical protein
MVDTLPFWAHAMICYLAACALLTMLFGVEWVIIRRCKKPLPRTRRRKFFLLD